MDYSITTREVTEQPVLVGRCRSPRTGIAASVGEVLPRVFQHAQEHGIALTGAPFVRYLDPNPEMMTFEPGMPISPETNTTRERGAPEAGLTFEVLPGGIAVTTIHVGPYETLHRAYRALERWMVDQGRTAAGAPWESYLTDPTTVPDPSEWKTEVVWPIAAR